MTHVQSSVPVLLLAALLAAAPAAAQGGTEDLFGETISVDLVNVEVFATDGSGDPVLDLGPDDFRVYEDGREVEVTHFALLRPGAGLRGGSGSPDGTIADGEGWVREAEPARIVVFLDFLHSGPASRKKIGAGLGGALEREMRPGDQVMVVAYDGSLDVVQPFTSDPAAVRRALENLAPITANQLQGQFADQRALEAVQLSQLMESGATKHPTGTCVRVGSLAETYADEAFNRVQQTVDALTGFVDSLAGIRGRKVLLHVSDGIPLVPGGEVLSYAIELCDGTGVIEGIEYSQDNRLMGAGQYQRWDPFSAKQRLNELDTTRDWQRLAAHANVEQVSIYPVQAAGLGSIRLTDAGNNVHRTARTRTFGVRTREDTLDLMARETGGRATLDSNDPGLGVEAALRDSRTHYLLGFEPAATKIGEVHRIRVEVDRPEVRLRHRQSYRAKGAHEQAADGVLTALFYGEVVNPLEAGLATASSAPLEDGRRKVRLRVEIPLIRLTLLPRGQRYDGLFTVFVAARDARGSTTPVRQVSIPVSVPPEGVGRDFVYELEMTLDAGTHDVAVGVRDELGGTTAFLRGEIPAQGSPQGPA